MSEQICDAVRDAVERGSLERGAELPSTRALAGNLKVSRNTVVAAYEELRALGIIESVRGSHTRVTGGGRMPRTKRLRDLVKGSGYPRKSRVIEDPDGVPLVVFSSTSG